MKNITSVLMSVWWMLFVIVGCNNGTSVTNPRGEKADYAESSKGTDLVFNSSFGAARIRGRAANTENPELHFSVTLFPKMRLAEQLELAVSDESTNHAVSTVAFKLTNSCGGLVASMFAEIFDDDSVLLSIGDATGQTCSIDLETMRVNKGKYPEQLMHMMVPFVPNSKFEADRGSEQVLLPAQERNRDDGAFHANPFIAPAVKYDDLMCELIGAALFGGSKEQLIDSSDYDDSGPQSITFLGLIGAGAAVIALTPLVCTIADRFYKRHCTDGAGNPDYSLFPDLCPKAKKVVDFCKDALIID